MQSSSLVVPEHFTEYEIRLYYTGLEQDDELNEKLRYYNCIIRYMYEQFFFILLEKNFINGWMRKFMKFL